MVKQKILQLLQTAESSGSKKNRGFGIIEVLVSIAIAATLLTTFSILLVKSSQVNDLNARELKASIYLQELIEITKDLEQSNWSAFDTSLCPSQCYPVASGNSWTLSSGPESLEAGIFNRSLKIEDVCRDANDKIIACGTTIDPDTKKIIATVHWNDGSHPDIVLESYAYNF